MKAQAKARGHVTGFFKIYENGSTGAGFNIEEGVKTTVTCEKSQRNSFEIKINGKKEKAKTSEIALKKILAKTKQKYKIAVKHETRFPIGFGLGLSGAGALSLTEAMDKALGLKLGKKEITEIAAQADIEAGTGLGDVYAEQYKGAMAGSPPYPSKKAVKLKNNYKYAVFGFFSPLETKKIIKSAKWKAKINKAGSYCMRKINKSKNIETLVRLSRVFSVETGLASKEVRRVMDAIPEASMAMLGNTVFILTNEPKKTERLLKKFAKKTAIGRVKQ